MGASAGFGTHFAQCLHEAVPIRIVLEDGLAPAVTTHGVVDRTGTCDSKPAHHIRRTAAAVPYDNIKHYSFYVVATNITQGYRHTDNSCVR